MKTRYTLTEADTKLLEEFQQASAEFYAAQQKLGDIDIGDPTAKELIKAYNKAFDERLNKAAVFAASVAASIGPEVTHG